VVGGDLVFSTAAFQRLFTSLYYERDKGGAAAVNFRESFGDAEGLTLPQLYHKHRHAGVRAEMVVYEAVRQVTIGQQGAEARTLCRWSAMLRHKARVEWVLGPPCPAANEPYMLVYDSSTEPNGDNVAGWALVDGRNKCAHGPADTCACELQMEWDVGVWEADVPGCGCKGGTREPCAGRCSCKGGNGAAAHQCGPMGRCLGGGALPQQQPRPAGAANGTHVAASGRVAAGAARCSTGGTPACADVCRCGGRAPDG
jgi:hypothetical protein